MLARLAGGRGGPPLQYFILWIISHLVDRILRESLTRVGRKGRFRRKPCTVLVQGKHRRDVARPTRSYWHSVMLRGGRKSRASKGRRTPPPDPTGRRMHHDCGGICLSFRPLESQHNLPIKHFFLQLNWR